MRAVNFKCVFILVFISVAIQWLAPFPVFGSEPILIDVTPGPEDERKTLLSPVNGFLLFSIMLGSPYSPEGYELWRTDGTEAGTVKLKSIGAGDNANAGGTLFFSTKYSGRWQLWKSDGTADGTLLVKEFISGTDYVRQLTAVGTTLFFEVDGTYQGGLWKSDGTEAGTVYVKNMLSSNYSNDLTPMDGILYMLGDGNELWKSDGTSDGTVMVKDIEYPGLTPTSLEVLDGTLFFSGDDQGAYGRELWKSDGTDAGTVMVRDIRPGSSDSKPGDITNVNGVLFFAADSGGAYGKELWKCDGTEAGTVMVRDIRPGGDASIDDLINVDGLLFFTATDGVNGVELWRSDGTEAGTVMVTTGNTAFDDFTAVNGILYFMSADDVHGRELWMSDGTEEGTLMVKDLWPGSDSSYPSQLININGLLFFTADDGVHGRELWVLAPPSHTLTIQSMAGGIVTTPGEGVFEYSKGTVVDLLAQPNPGYRFLGWTGDTENLSDSGAAQTTVTMAGDYTLSASFEAAPDLVVTDVWEDDGQVCYQLKNAGAATTPSGHSSHLIIDDGFTAADLIETELLPGERLTRCFSSGTWNCSSLSDAVRIDADGGQQIVESDEENNARSEDWQCDTTPPVFTTLPVASQILGTSAEITWSTDTPANSVVMYGAAGGVYEDQVEGQQQTDTHLVALEDLQPATTYHYSVVSTDESGNTVESEAGFFRTDPAPDDTPPVIAGVQISRGAGDLLFYTVAADVSDNTGVDRVEFFLDGVLVCTDYAAPFDCQLAPMYAEISSGTFFNAHSVEAVAYDKAGMNSFADTLFEPAHECPEIRAHMEAPNPDDVYYIESTTVPLWTTIPIRVRASMPELNCGNMDLSGLPDGANRFFCEEEEHAVSEVRFYVDNTLLEVQSPTTAYDFGFEYTWDIGELTPGNYEIRVDVVGNDDCTQTITHSFQIERGEPEIHVAREVTRIGNYFQVDIIVKNLGTLSEEFHEIDDIVYGFQPIAKNEADYDITANCPSNGYHCLIDITFPGGGGFTIEPESSKRFSYLAVPVLYPPGQAVPYGIGTQRPIELLDGNERVLYEFDRQCLVTEAGETLESEVNDALRRSDYLIVTDATRLDSISNDTIAFNDLLSSMAELARYRNGILGKLIGPTNGPGDPHWVKDSIRAWGSSMRGADGGAGRYLSNGGYLLLVGETEIIPSFTKTLKRYWYDSDRGTVYWTDLPYADMSGDVDPELSVGRIIGDTPEEMRLPIDASIKVAKGEPGFVFDRSDALIASGDGNPGENGSDVEAFEESLDEWNDILVDEFVVTSIKYSAVDDAGGDVNAEFKNNDGNRDLIGFNGHCNPTGWGGVIGTGDFGGADPIDFEDAKPVGLAICCQAGQYEDDSDQAADLVNMAESFLQNGAPAYIGATVNSYIQQNASASAWFYNHWVNTSKPLGQTFRELKVHLDGYAGDFWSHEYNLYGDAKYGGVETAAGAPLAMKPMSVPLSPYQIVIPGYQVNTVGVEDHVTIPEGNMMLEYGKPAVPFYKVRLEYPAGYSVQKVTLSERSGMTTATGLNIPVFEMSPAAEGGTTSEPSAGEEWWPSLERVFSYKFETRHDGTSVLTIILYPFYYNALTTDVRFFQNYTFDIQIESSDTAIAAFKTADDYYDPGEVVHVDLGLVGSGTLQNAIVEILVKEEGTGETVSGLPLRMIDTVTEKSTLSFDWDSSSLVPGSYYLEANLRNSDGELLSTLRKPIQLGGPVVVVDSFTATLETPTNVSTSFTFRNAGSLAASGTSVVRFLNEHDETVDEFRHAFSDLQPAMTSQVEDVWDVSGVAPGLYTAQAYVLYDSTSSEVQTRDILICSDLKGDINGDGLIDLADAVLGLQILAGSGASVSCGTFDVNGDNIAGLEEILYVFGELLHLRAE
jgi:ELWxxDGT repeat protein